MKRWLPPTALVLVGALVAVAAGGCTTRLDKSVASAPVLSVVTGLWPLSQAASAIGGDKVAVDDLVPVGADPLTYDPGAEGTRVLHGAGLVVEVGGGFQPALERAAVGAPRVTRLGGVSKAADPYVWLDPAAMEDAVTAIAGAMAAANPAAASLYQRNAGGLRAQLQSLQIDFSSTLSTCPGTTVVTPDGAFSALAHDLGLTDVVIGPTPTASEAAAARSRLSNGSAVALVSEPWVDDAGVRNLARTTGTELHQVDTLAGPPADPPAQNPFFDLMTQNLDILSRALGCNNNEQ